MYIYISIVNPNNKLINFFFLSLFHFFSFFLVSINNTKMSENNCNVDVQFSFKPNKISRQLASPSTSKTTSKTSKSSNNSSPASSNTPQVCKTCSDYSLF